MDDDTITAHIADLTAELDALGPDEEERAAELTALREQSRDLLRQRVTRRQLGEDPGLAEADTDLDGEPVVDPGAELAALDRALLRGRALVLHDLAARGADTADVVDRVDAAVAERRWWVRSWPDGLELVAGQIAQDVQDVMIDTEGRWPGCPAHPQEAMALEPELGPEPHWVCAHGCGVVAPLGALSAGA
ncbi:MAG: hypothetical protein ABI181_12400 [Mycobacteriaceae bacterium]